MRTAIFILLLLPMVAFAQPKYKVHAYFTHAVSEKGKTMIKRYAKEFVEGKRDAFRKPTNNTGVPEQYGKVNVYEDDKGVYMDVILLTHKRRDEKTDMVVYGTFAFLAKDNRTRIELRDVYYTGEARNGCPPKGTIDEYIDCMSKADKTYADWMRENIQTTMVWMSTQYKNHVAEANRRVNDELEIGDDW